MGPLVVYEGGIFNLQTFQCNASRRALEIVNYFNYCNKNEIIKISSLLNDKLFNNFLARRVPSCFISFYVDVRKILYVDIDGRHQTLCITKKLFAFSRCTEVKKHFGQTIQIIVKRIEENISSLAAIVNL